MSRTRYDETWHRLLEWTKGQTQSERLASQILLAEGYKELDPSHPLGGPDGGKDAIAIKDGKRFVMAVYFPRGHQTSAAVKSKFEGDAAGIKGNAVDGIVFVTNQEVTLGERETLVSSVAPAVAVLYHLERITNVLDQPIMAPIRSQFLDMDDSEPVRIDLGGKGGDAPGAGGGGGGVLGDGRGGDGGDGGDRILLRGEPGKYYGAGGGGAGAIGEGAKGAEGGSGGEMVESFLPLEPGMKLDIQVGKGGDNGPGGDSIINVVDKDGHIVRTIRARGGKQGAAGYVPTKSGAYIGPETGLKVMSIVAAEYIRTHATGLVTMVDGFWTVYRVVSSPFAAAIPLIIELHTGNISPGEIVEIAFVVTNPTGFRALDTKQSFEALPGNVRRTRVVHLVEFTGSVAGIWTISIFASDRELVSYPIEIILPD